MENDWITHTPMMRQWSEMKIDLGEDVILFCRIGDFYELFYEDAVIGAKELDIALTARKIGDTEHPLAGVPVRSIDTYVGRLVAKGYKVAIADQLEDPKAVKGVVKRGITRIVTKGTLIDESLLQSGKNNYIAAVVERGSGKGKTIGLAVADLSVGDFFAKEFAGDDAVSQLRYALDITSPVEYVYPESMETKLDSLIKKEPGSEETFSSRPDFWFESDEAMSVLLEHFEVKSLKGFGIADRGAAACAAGALLRYLAETQMRKISNITKIQVLNLNNVMILDRNVLRSLEIFQNTYDKTEIGTLVSILDQTVTAMGGRMLRRWLSSPLVDRSEIERRWELVELFRNEEIHQNHLQASLNAVHDIERIATRISLGMASPPELIKLKESLETIPEILGTLRAMENVPVVKEIAEKIDSLEDVLEYLKKWVHPEPASSPADGYVIADGVNPRLDELRQIIKEGEDWVKKYQEAQIERTGISSLKIKQNRQLGYYIEVTRKNKDKVPNDYISRQAMVNAVRYVTEELKNWESDILNAEVEIVELETKLYENLLENLSRHFDRIHELGQTLGYLDCLVNFAYIATVNGYVKPKLTEDIQFHIKGGRHPVIEKFLSDSSYVPNEVRLDKEANRLLIVTGPNYSGKSSLLRMVAINVIMAQIGSFVPAEALALGIFDRIFTRIGASDNLIAGQSTFLVEMLDAANFVNNCTERSLIIADEIGRGTSTYDGLAIAWAISEYLHNNPAKPLTMIATHYHQLSELEGFLEAAKNYHFQISFDGEKPIFNHKLFRGASDRSFGVEVAKLAGLPMEIIVRARFILNLLESQSASIDPHDLDKSVSRKIVKATQLKEGQASLAAWFGEEQDSPQTTKTPVKKEVRKDKPVQVPTLQPEQLEVIETIKSLNIELITPIKALQILEDLKKILEGLS